MRFPLASDLSTRDGSLTKDARMHNCFVNEGNVFKRPATNTNLVTVTAAEAQGMIYGVNGLMYAITGDVMRSYNSSFTLIQTITL